MSQSWNRLKRVPQTPDIKFVRWSKTELVKLMTVYWSGVWAQSTQVILVDNVPSSSYKENESACHNRPGFDPSAKNQCFTLEGSRFSTHDLCE